MSVWRRRCTAGETEYSDCRIRPWLCGNAGVLDAGAPHKVDLVLSDINMPGMSGIDLLAHIRRNWPDVKVIMITAYGDPDTEIRAHDLGAARFLTKPVEFERLKQDLA